NDENSATQNKQIAEDIIGLRQAGAIGVVGIHHGTKAMRDKGMTLETVLRGTGDLAACADAVYGMLRDNNLYNHGAGPNEIEVECVKPRDFDPPYPFRIAASRKSDELFGPDVESIIGLAGDFAVVDDIAVEAVRDSQLIRLVQEDPRITLDELEKATGIQTRLIRKSLTRQGWIKKRGVGSGWFKPAAKPGSEPGLTRLN